MRTALKEALDGPLWPSGRELFWFLVGAGFLTLLIVTYGVFRLLVRRRLAPAALTDDSNRRQALRVPASADLRLLPIGGGTGCPARLIEFSSGGMSLVCEIQLKAPAEFTVELAPFGGPAVAVRWQLLRVARTRGRGSKGWVLHGRFADLSKDDEKTLQRWVFQRERELAHARKLRELRG